MEKREVFLEKNKSSVSVNKESEIGVSLSTKSRLLPYSDIDEKLSLFKLYNEERDACNRYRMIFTVNPICTNVLFNAKTEVVRKEGSDECVVLNNDDGLPSGNFINKTNINVLQAIRDTEYTHKGFFDDEDPYVYHCGWDIFNNHMLRNDDFTHISKPNSDSNRVFNTIKDYLRDKNGDTITEKINVEDVGLETKMHVYQYDNILTMYNAFKNRLDEKNGWYGFTNPGNIEIANAEVNGKEISINRMMNNNKACELYELYPDQSLYSFIPKVNKYRNRLEYNWDYDIVYPYENEYDLLKTIVGAENWEYDDLPLKAISSMKSSSQSGTDFVKFKTMFKHTFKQGDYVKLFYKQGNTFVKVNKRFKVVKCGDELGNNLDRYFYIRATDLTTDFKFENNGNVVFTESGEKVNFYYKKDVNGYDCKYYIRKLKRIKTERFESEVNKLAFGENIYGDRVAQIIFTDDIDVEGLVDNLGRPVSEVYLYVLKTNRGNKEWYQERDYRNENVEFSHCFGKITTGLDLPSECTDYNVRKLHNVEKPYKYLDGFSYAYSGSCISGNTQPKPIQDDLTIESLDDDGFVYGDIVEFDPCNYTETIIENIYHRFNTAQRETINEDYFDLWDDEIVYDDYDADINTSVYDRSNSFFVSTTLINKVNANGVEMNLPGNIAPEGYFYNPKTPIKLVEVSDILSSVYTKQIKYKLLDVSTLPIVNEGYDEEGNAIYYHHANFEISTKYDFIKGDFVSLYQSEDDKIFYGIVCSVDGRNIEVSFEGNPNFSYLSEGSSSLLTTRDYVAPYAEFLPSSRSFVWRGLINPSELPNDSDIYDRPFTNGCFYIHQNVNFFLKRQDPRNEFGLLYPEDANDNNEPQTKYYKKPGNGLIDLTSYEVFSDTLNNICY